jgi:hypothetical protein
MYFRFFINLFHDVLSTAEQLAGGIERRYRKALPVCPVSDPKFELNPLEYESAVLITSDEGFS